MVTKTVATKTWGRWQLDRREPQSLNIRFTSWYEYEIPLSQCRTEKAREAWIEHMAEKQGINQTDIEDLKRAFSELAQEGK